MNQFPKIKKILYKNILTVHKNEEFHKTAEYLVPIMEQRMEKMKDFINDIPEKNGDVYICSDVRKKYYIKSIEYRYNYFILPVYKK